MEKILSNYVTFMKLKYFSHRQLSSSMANFIFKIQPESAANVKPLTALPGAFAPTLIHATLLSYIPRRCSALTSYLGP